jgi:hypothetical protein
VHVIELRDLAQDIANNPLTGFAASRRAGPIFITQIITTS